MVRYRHGTIPLLSNATRCPGHRPKKTGYFKKKNVENFFFGNGKIYAPK